MPNIQAVDSSYRFEIAANETGWTIYVEENQLAVPRLADTDIFGIASVDDRGSDITDWYAFFTWGDNEWIQVDHWDDLNDNQKYTLACWYYNNWNGSYFTTTDYLPWVGTNIHGLIILENL